MILSLEGCMAVGKTTALRAVAGRFPRLDVCEEDISGAVRQVQTRGLDKRVYADYLEIQRIWIRAEIDRFRRAEARGKDVLLDYGPSEIEFYTLFYPRSLDLSWDVASPLAGELAALRACRARRILFLDASEAALIARRDADSGRKRAFFDHTLHRLAPQKRAWFAARGDTDFLDTTALSPAEAADAVAAWCARQLL